MESNKMSKPTIRIHNTETDEVIDREMTKAEIEILEANKIAILNNQAQIEETRQLKISAYQKLGLTEAEIEALLPTPKPVTQVTD
jgi:hypothetical protein